MKLPIATRLLLFFYNLLFPVGLVVMLPGFLVKMARRGKYRSNFGQRFGLYSDAVKARLAGKRSVWIHAVSVGEVFIALKLVAKMKAMRPELNIVLSTTTSTGFALAQKSGSDWLEVIYNPLDFAFAVRRALDLIQPSQIILVEAEVWPNLARAATRRGIPLSLVNARLSPRSENRFRRFRLLVGPIFRLLDVICVQEPEDIARWESLGVDSARLQCTGSIKFDHSDDPLSRAGEFRRFLDSLGVHSDAPILLAGSTFAGEEKIMANLLLELRRHFPDLFLVIVPRHVERTSEIVETLKSTGLRFALRTDVPGQPGAKIDCLVVNTTGELRDWYHLATVVFIGKSLTAIGGQNPVEAVVAGKPVLFGPHMENFAAIVHRWLARNAAIQVANTGALKNHVTRLLENPLLRETMCENARQAVAVHQGATERTARLLFP